MSIRVHTTGNTVLYTYIVSLPMTVIFLAPSPTNHLTLPCIPVHELMSE